MAGSAVGPATSVAAYQTVNEEIAVELDRLFGCVAVRDWAGVSTDETLSRASICAAPAAVLTMTS